MERRGPHHINYNVVRHCFYTLAWQVLGCANSNVLGHIESNAQYFPNNSGKLNSRSYSYDKLMVTSLYSQFQQ